MLTKHLRLNVHRPHPLDLKKKPAIRKQRSFQQHMRPIKFNAFRRPHATDTHGIFGLLDTYHKTRHPMQPPYGVWDIPDPNFFIEYEECRIEGWLKQWRKSIQGKAYVEKYVRKEVKKDSLLNQKFESGILLLNKEKEKLKQNIVNLRHNKKYGIQSNAILDRDMNENEINFEIRKIDDILENLARNIIFV